MRDHDHRPQLSIEDLEPPPRLEERPEGPAETEGPRGVAVIWPPPDDDAA